MVESYLSDHGLPITSVFNRPFQLLALRQLRITRHPDPGLLEPVLMPTSG
jgi:hypothetical protein